VGLFSRNLNEVKAAGGSAGMKLTVGEYTLVLTEVKGVQTRSLGPAIDFIFKVAESSGEGATPVGSVVNEYCIEGNDIGAHYMKSVMVCLLGLDGSRAEDAKAIREEDWNDVRDALLVEGNKILGRRIVCSARTATKKKNGESYVRKNYSPDPAVRAETLKKLAAAKK
jgi:hypothetical protein